MSTKKQLRRERRRRQDETKVGKRMNPATLFIVGVAAALIVLGTFAFFFRGDARPPFPGAVWSVEHRHWH